MMDKSRINEIKLKALSYIDEDIIDKNTEERIKRYNAIYKIKTVGGGSKYKKAVIIAVAAALALSLMLAILIPLLTKDVPIYKGMSVSGDNAYSTLDADAELSLEFLADGGNGKDNGNNSGGDKHSGNNDGQNGEENTLGIVGGGEPAYFAKKNEDVYITVHIENPDEFEIVSFTLNGVKYTNYMFEEGSDLEHLVLKVNVGEAQGYVDYTIDAIKYIDGTEIKDVKMEGDKTVKVGVYPEDQPRAWTSDISVDYDSIALNVNVKDILGLITEENSVRVELYSDKGELVESKTVNNSGVSSVTFNGLSRATYYTCKIMINYDAVDGNMFGSHEVFAEGIWTKYSEDVPYTVNHYLQKLDGTYSLELSETLIGIENRVIIPNVKSFDNYKIPESQKGKILLDGSLVINYYYELQEYYTYFASNGGEMLQPVKYRYGDTIDLPEAVREGYTFGGWYTDIGLTEEYTAITQGGDSLLLYAYWQEETKTSDFKLTEDGFLESYIGDGVDVVIPSYVGDERVEEIGFRMFYECAHVKSVTVPQGVKVIGAQAFQECMNLENVVIPDSVISIGDQAFYNCVSLESIRLPGGLKVIGRHLFASCINLESVEIPESVTSINSGAFKNCEALVSMTVPEGVTVIDISVFDGCILLESVVMSDNVTSIGREAFKDCISLKNINIPNSIEEIQSGAFESCGSLVNITLPAGIKAIGTRAFHRCDSLENIIVPKGILVIENDTFYSCKSLKSIILPEGLMKIGNNAFSYCESLESIDIPVSVISIGEGAFQQCSGLKDIKIPDGVKDIGKSTFNGCDALESVRIPDKVGKIGSSAFGNCIGLKSIIISDSVTNIAEYAFYNCTSLTDVYYTGSKEEWDNILKEAHNEKLEGASIHYNYNG